ncbi:DUF2087 domain-containing protein [Streptomyces marincola]|uniref:DUF2087 domain-containing protein n=1 Tax=Streptomyces marincola TaxID=2878388 RepID=UPI001CF1F13F|nr:DUF2087 domain-containing protein [Streptomyces marincola]UCM88682.1 DUF2087 domain-containing protein [Streptomyces marincola]
MSVTARSPRRPGSAALSDAADALLALSNGRRLALLHTVTELNAASGPAGLSDVAGRLGLDVRTVSKEVVRLTEAGLLDRHGGELTADTARLGELAAAVAEFTALCQVVPPGSPLRRYLTHGRVSALPKNPDDLGAMARALAELLPEDRSLTETEVNEILGQAGDDVAGLRRLLADQGLVDRSGAAGYRRRPPAGGDAATTGR